MQLVAQRGYRAAPCNRWVSIVFAATKSLIFVKDAESWPDDRLIRWMIDPQRV